MNEPKFKVGDKVKIKPRDKYWTFEIFMVERSPIYPFGWTYSMTFHKTEFWAENLLISIADWEVYQEQYKRGVEQRQREDAETLAHLEAIEPVRGLFDTDEDFQFAYCQWAESFWGVGDMPYVVRRLYNQYMMGNQWTIARG
jgi:hypothetical protein